MLPSVRPLLLTAALLSTHPLRTATADGRSVDLCSQFTCVLDCNDECGWDSHDDVCRTGQTTSTSELYRKLGCTSTSTVPTPGASDSDADKDACSQIICALDCNDECGWDGDDDVCRAGLTTADLDRTLRSGDCGDADPDEDSGDFGSSESGDYVPTSTASTTANPTKVPTANPTANPTTEPTGQPTANPTANPTMNPTATPSANPTKVPTTNPTANTVTVVTVTVATAATATTTAATDVSSTVTVMTVSVAVPIDTTDATASPSEAAGFSDSLTIGPLTPQSGRDGFTVEVGYSLQNRSTANMVLMMRRKGQSVWQASVGVIVEARTHTGITSVTVPILAGDRDVETMILFVALLTNDALGNRPEDRLAVGRAVVTVTDFMMAPPTTELPCTDTEGFLDRLGYSCSDWQNVPCTEFDGYDADAMADIRKDCQQTCDTCRTPTTEGSGQTCLAVSKACDGNGQCCSGQCQRSHNGAAVCRAGPGSTRAPVLDNSSDDANAATESIATSFGWTLLLVLAVVSSLLMAWRSKSFPTTSKNNALLENLRYENDDDYLEMPSSLEVDAFAAEDELVFSRRA